MAVSSKISAMSSAPASRARLAKYKYLIGCLHLKDLAEGFSKENLDSSFVAIGSGVVNNKDAILVKEQFNLGEYGIIIDQDKSNGDILEDLKEGFEFVKSL